MTRLAVSARLPPLDSTTTPLMVESARRARAKKVWSRNLTPASCIISSRRILSFSTSTCMAVIFCGSPSTPSRARSRSTISENRPFTICFSPSKQPMIGNPLTSVPPMKPAGSMSVVDAPCRALASAAAMPGAAGTDNNDIAGRFDGGCQIFLDHGGWIRQRFKRHAQHLTGPDKTPSIVRTRAPRIRFAIANRSVGRGAAPSSLGGARPPRRAWPPTAFWT